MSDRVNDMADSAIVRAAAGVLRTRGGAESAAVADLLMYEAERFFNEDEAAPGDRYIRTAPRERRLVLTLARLVLDQEGGA